MAMEEDASDIKKKIRLLYAALREKDCKAIAELCSEFPEGPLQRISLDDDTVFHLAAQSKRKGLLLDLLKMLPPAADNIHHRRRLSDIRNTEGNTVLHEVATNEAMIDVAEELLKRDPNLLTQPNKLGEKPIFAAARYGQTRMFKFLAKKMELEKRSPEERKTHLQRDDGTTVLHISVAIECFWLAYTILECYPCLINEKDGSSMTALQYLACNPAAFQRIKETQRGVIEKLSSSSIETYQESGFRRAIIENATESLRDTYEYWFSMPRHVCSKLLPRYFSVDDETTNKTGPYHQRMLLHAAVNRLIVRDASLHAYVNSQAVGPDEGKETKIEEDHSYTMSQTLTSKNKKGNENPLFMATKSNVIYIVKRILQFHPEALHMTNEEGMNILHVAILYRHIEIFDMVVKFEVLARRLLSATDKEGNSALHMVSQKRKSQTSEKLQSPALQLRDELLLFEKVKSACQMLVTNPLNNDNKTAEELFVATNEQLHRDAKEWLMRTTENCTILSVFIATVAFAAAFTVPGGPNQETGIPILHSKPFFLVFILADVVSITSALTSVGIFLSILTSSFPLQDFKAYLFKKLIQGIICLVLSVSMMAVAFGATIVLMMSRNQKNVGWGVAAFLPVPIFFLSYSPLRSLVIAPFKPYVVNFSVVFAYFILLLPYEIVCCLVQEARKFIFTTGRWIYGKISCTCKSPEQPATPPHTDQV